MVTFIDQHRDTYGVEPICAVLPIAPSTYFLRKAQQRRLARGRRARGATTSCARRFSACGTTTNRCTGRGKCGSSCCAATIKSAARVASFRNATA